MATFPKELKPIYVDNNDLIRLGSIDDGGYVVPIKTIMNSRSLVSFGISDNWDFEKDFVKKSKVNVFGYDHSIDNSFWLSRFKKDLIKFLKLKDFRKMRQWVADNMDSEPAAIFRKLYDTMYEYVDSKSIPQLVLILADYQYKNSFVADHELNLVACLTEIMANTEFK